MTVVVMDEVARIERFLDDVGRIRGATATPATFLEAAGYPNYENVASNLLRYFLDPAEGHGLSGLFLNGLLEPLGFEAVSVRSVEREVQTLNGNFIDVLIDGQEHLIGVENKIYASVNNPLGDYLGHLQRNAAGRQVGLILLCVNEPQPRPEHVVVVTYEELMGRVRRDLGRYADEVPAQYVSFSLDFARTMENRKRGTRMNPEVLELLTKREDDVYSVLEAVNALRSENGSKGNELWARVQELSPVGVRSRLGKLRYWQVPNGLDGAAVHDIDFPSGEQVTVDAWIGTYGWEVTVFQRRTPGRKLAAGELATWLVAHGAPFLVEVGATALKGSRPVTARFERYAPIEDVARHVAAVVKAIAEAGVAPGEKPPAATPS